MKVIQFKPQQLGILGVGMSKEEALQKFEDAYQALLDLRGTALALPKAAFAIGAWKNIESLQTGFNSVRDAVSKMSKGVTRWGTYADKANEFAGYFKKLESDIKTAAEKTGEKPLADKPEGDGSGEIPWALLGGIAVAGVILWTVAAKKTR